MTIKTISLFVVKMNTLIYNEITSTEKLHEYYLLLNKKYPSFFLLKCYQEKNTFVFPNATCFPQSWIKWRELKSWNHRCDVGLKQEKAGIKLLRRKISRIILARDLNLRSTIWRTWYAVPLKIAIPNAYFVK